MLLAVLALGNIPCRGARPYQPVCGDPLLQPWCWRTFPELNGLGLECLTEGTDGAIWFGTAKGVWCYDGFRWIHHSIKEGLNGNVGTLCQGADGSLFTGGQSGISQFSGGKWTHLFPSPGQSFGGIRKLAVGRDGSLWAATSWGALRCQQSKWTLYTDREIAGRMRTNQSRPYVSVELLPETILTKSRTNNISKSRRNGVPPSRLDFAEVCVDNQGRIWLGSADGEILCGEPSAPVQAASNAIPAVAAGKWAIYNESDGLVCGRNPSILQLQNGAMWVVYEGSSGYANVFDGATWKAFRLADAGALDDCQSLIQTRDGTIWLSGRYVLCAGRDGHWRTYEKPAVPIPSASNLILQSSDGALWIAGANTEVMRLDYQTSRWLTYQDLNFQWESPAGAQWFLHRDGRVVVHETNQWTSYGVEDGLMDAPVALLGTQNGDIWVAGSHEHTAATARFDGSKWTRQIHDDLSWGVDWRATLESSDGSVWFGAAVDSSSPKQQIAGIMQFHNGVWTHHHQPGRLPPNGGEENPAVLLPATRQGSEPVGKFVWLGESRDGKIWAGRSMLAFYDGHTWAVHSRPGWDWREIEAMLTTREKDISDWHAAIRRETLRRP